MKYKVLLWDFDGTLVDTSEGIYSSLEKTFDRMGVLSPGREILSKFIGPPIVYSLQTYVGMPPEEALRALAIFREDYENGGCYRARVYDGIEPLLKRLHSCGIQNAVTTMKPEASAKLLLRYFKLDGLFDYCAGNTNDSNESTTKTQLIHRALNQLGCTNRSDAALIGDTVYDADGAREAGIDFIGAAYGFGIAPGTEMEMGCRAVAWHSTELEELFFAKDN